MSATSNTAARFVVEAIRCGCHPETCCCADARLRMDGESISTGSFEGMQRIADKLIAAITPPQEGGEQEAQTYFCFDGYSFDTYPTLEEAKKNAEDALQCFADQAGDGWDELVEQICYGVVTGEVFEADRRPRTLEDYGVDSGIDTIVDYQLRDIPKAAAAEQRLVQSAEPDAAISVLLDWQPLTHINKGDRLWQILENAGLPADDQRAALARVVAGVG